MAQAIETQRQQLSQIRALVDSQANLLHESYRFEVDEADLGNCCDVVRDMLERIITALESVTRALAAESAPAEPMRLAHAIEAPRQELFAPKQ